MSFLAFILGFFIGAAAGYYKWGRKQSTADAGPRVTKLDDDPTNPAGPPPTDPA